MSDYLVGRLIAENRRDWRDFNRELDHANAHSQRIIDSLHDQLVRAQSERGDHRIEVDALARQISHLRTVNAFATGTIVNHKDELKRVTEESSDLRHALAVSERRVASLEAAAEAGNLATAKLRALVAGTQSMLGRAMHALGADHALRAKTGRRFPDGREQIVLNETFAASFDAECAKSGLNGPDHRQVAAEPRGDAENAA